MDMQSEWCKSMIQPKLYRFLRSLFHSLVSLPGGMQRAALLGWTAKAPETMTRGEYFNQTPGSSSNAVQWVCDSSLYPSTWNPRAGRSLCA